MAATTRVLRGYALACNLQERTESDRRRVKEIAKRRAGWGRGEKANERAVSRTESHWLELQSEGCEHDLGSHLLDWLPQIMSLAVVQSVLLEHDLGSHLVDTVLHVESRNMFVQ